MKIVTKKGNLTKEAMLAVGYYISGESKKDALEKAGWKKKKINTAYQYASNFFRHPAVVKYQAYLLDQRLNYLDIDLQRIIREQTMISLGSAPDVLKEANGSLQPKTFKEMGPWAGIIKKIKIRRTCLATGEKVTEENKDEHKIINEEIDLELYDKNTAARTLLQFHGQIPPDQQTNIFVNQENKIVNYDLSKLSDDELNMAIEIQEKLEDKDGTNW